MAKFKYVGAGDTPPDVTVIFGQRLTRGGPGKEFTDPHHISKLTNNPSFAQVKERAKKSKE